MVGNTTSVKIVKNKVAPPFREAMVDIMYNEGISATGEAIDLGVQHEVVKKSGAFYSYGDTRLGQGRENAKAYLKENPKLLTEILTKIRKSIS